MKIVIIGDLHGDFVSVEKIMAREKDIHLFLCVGDIVDDNGDYFSPLKRLWFIHGNHENFDTIAGLDSGKIYIGNLCHIRPDIKYYFSEFSTIGFGGNYASSKYDKPCPKGIKGFNYRDGRRHFHKSDVKKVMKLGCADILLTHEAPVPYKVERKSGKIDEGGIPIINEIKKAVNPRFHFYGHHHRKYIDGNSIGMPYPKDGYIVLDTVAWQIEWRVAE